MDGKLMAIFLDGKTSGIKKLINTQNIDKIFGQFR